MQAPRPDGPAPTDQMRGDGMDQNTTSTRAPRRRLGYAALALSSAAVFGLAVGMGPREGVSATEAAATSGSPASGAVQAWPGYADLIEEVMPSVVGVTAKREINRELSMRGEGGQQRSMPFDFDEDSPDAEMFKRFMERFFGDQGQFGEEGRPFGQGPRMPHGHGFQAPVAGGSGFIVSEDGLIVTNNHVIDGASEVSVTLHDGDELDATLIGSDPDTDLALLKVDTARDLQAVTFADASKVRVGDAVISIGSPFGLGGTVTAGIVSADNRAIGAGRYDDFLQTDAAINRGNSGGPTFNLAGEVIGVNTLIHSPSGGNVGIGFAIPADLAQRIIADLQDDGMVERGWLGVHIQGVDEDLAAGFGLEDAEGALVSRVMPDSPAAAAGIRQGDVIVGYADQDIKDLRDLTRAVADTPPNQATEVVVWRDGAETTLDVEIGLMPSEGQQVAALDSEADDATPRLGVALAALTSETRARLELDEDVEGVVVTEVMPGSPAAEKGIRQGDVILEADRTQVDSPEGVVEAVRRAAERDEGSILLLLRREGQDRFVAVPLERV
jgi:serine protease Do